MTSRMIHCSESNLNGEPKIRTARDLKSLVDQRLSRRVVLWLGYMTSKAATEVDINPGTINGFTHKYGLLGFELITRYMCLSLKLNQVMHTNFSLHTLPDEEYGK